MRKHPSTSRSSNGRVQEIPFSHPLELERWQLSRTLLGACLRAPDASASEHSVELCDISQELALVQLQLFHSVLHFSHFFSLIINDVANALLDVLLLGIGVQVSGDRIQEL